MLRRRITVIFDCLDVSPYRIERRGAPGLKIAHKPRRATLRDVEYVVQHENLPIDIGTRADAYNRYLERVPDVLAEFIRDTFQ